MMIDGIIINKAEPKFQDKKGEYSSCSILLITRSLHGGLPGIKFLAGSTGRISPRNGAPIGVGVGMTLKRDVGSTSRFFASHPNRTIIGTVNYLLRRKQYAVNGNQ